MVFWSGTKSRGQIDGVTVDRDYTCKKCAYTGHLLLRLLEQKRTVYSIPVSGWNEKGGWLVCPACGAWQSNLASGNIKRFRSLTLDRSLSLRSKKWTIPSSGSSLVSRTADTSNTLLPPSRNGRLRLPTALSVMGPAAPTTTRCTTTGSGYGPNSTPRHATQPPMSEISSPSTEPSVERVDYDADYDLTEWTSDQRTRLTRLLDATGVPFSLRNLHLLVDRRFESEVDDILESMNLH